MDSHTLLGIDLGTSALKAVLVTDQGKVVASARGAYPIHRPRPDRAEQDPSTWWEALVRCMGTLRAQGVLDGVRAIGLSGQMHGTVLLDRQGKPLGPAVIWPDRRSVSQVALLGERVGLERLIRIAGSPPATGFMAGTLAWFQEHEPQTWAQVRHVLLPKDFLRLQLTGEVATDPSDASGTLLLDVGQRTWSQELLAAVGVRPALLPQICPSSQVAGYLTQEAASALGLAPGIPVVTGGGDTACSALAAAAVSPGTLLLTMGTGGQLVLPVDRPRVDAQGRIHTFCHVLEPGVDRAGWYQMGATLAAGMALAWLREQVFGLSGEDAYARMTSWAQEVPPGAQGLLFLPYLVGERTPHMDPHARGVFLGLTPSHGRGHLVRAVMEGVVLALFDAFQVLAELGAMPRAGILAGGGARNPLWRRMVADIFGLPVRPLQTADQSATGAALLAGAGLGWFDPVDAARQWAVLGPVEVPDPERSARYRTLGAVYRALYPRLRDLFPALAEPGHPGGPSDARRGEAAEASAEPPDDAAQVSP